MEDGVEYGIEKKGEGAYHYHNFKGHYEKDKNTPLRNDTLDPFSEARFIHRQFAPFCYERPALEARCFLRVMLNADVIC